MRPVLLAVVNRLQHEDAQRDGERLTAPFACHHPVVVFGLSQGDQTRATLLKACPDRRESRERICLAYRYARVVAGHGGDETGLG